MKNAKKNEGKQPPPIKELIKPLDIQTEDKFFEIQSLCQEFGAGIECKGVNKAIDEDSDLLF